MRNEAHMNYLRRKTADVAELWAADRIEELERELECERMRLVACGVVAMADTPDSAKKVRQMHPDYESASCESVARRVDECISLREKCDALQADRDEWKARAEFSYKQRDELEREIERKMSAAAFVLKERDALQADNARLRKALDVYRNVADPADWSNRPAEAALAATPAQSLASIRNQVRDECIEIIACNLIGFADDDEDLNNMIAKIRAMKEPE